MSLHIEQRGFTIGRQVGGCGRCTRFVLGLLGLAYSGTVVVHLGENTASLAPHGDFLAPRRVHSPPRRLGVGGSALLVGGLSRRGTLILRWRRR